MSIIPPIPSLDPCRPTDPLACNRSPSSAGCGSPLARKPLPSVLRTEHVILFVLEGFSQESLKGGAMPVLSKLVKEGSVTWSASGVKPALRLPTMASLVTGMPVEKHGITWNSFEFSRGYPRPPSLFDYLDLSGGRDSAIFFMDESLYQLAKPDSLHRLSTLRSVAARVRLSETRRLHPAVFPERRPAGTATAMRFPPCLICWWFIFQRQGGPV